MQTIKKAFCITNAFLLISLVILAVFLLSCSDNRTTITVSGSSTAVPVVSAAAEHYMLKNRDVRIIVNSGGSGMGINQVSRGQTDIAMVSRDLTEAEIDQFRDSSPAVYTIAKDAVAPAVSSEVFNSGVTSLTREQIAAIYRGEITNWSQLGGSDSRILVIDKEKSRGTRHIFMSYVMGDPEADAPGAHLVLGSNNEEQTALMQSDSAIGLISIAWLNEGVKGLSIVTEEGIVLEPSIENIMNGSWPLGRDLDLVTNDKPDKAVIGFIDYILSDEGQTIVESAGYVRISR